MFALPPEVKALLAYLITQGLKAFLALFGKDISGVFAAIVAAFVAAFLLFAEGVIGALPPDVQNIVVVALNALVAILGAFGVHYTYQGLKR